MPGKELALLLFATACATVRPDKSRPLIYPTPSPEPVSAPLPTAIPRPTEIVFPTATDVPIATTIATALILPTVTETEIAIPPFVTGKIDLRQNFTVTTPDDTNIDVLPLPQQDSQGWDNDQIKTFENLYSADSRRSCLVLKTDIPGVTMLVCHSFYWDGIALPFDWVIEQNNIGKSIGIKTEGHVQTYTVTSSVSLSEKLASPILNSGAYRQQAGGIYVDTAILGIPQDIRQSLSKNDVIIQVCQGEFSTSAVGNAFTEREFAVMKWDN